MSAEDHQYEYDGQRLARGLFRLGFRSLVPRRLEVGSWSDEIGLFVANEHGVFARNSAPSVTSWAIACGVLVNMHDPFAKDEVSAEVDMTEPFTAAGRCKVRVKVPSSPLLVAGQQYDIVFRVIKNDKPVSPVIPPHPLRIDVPGTFGTNENNDDDEEDYLSCCRLVIPSINWRDAPRLIIGESASNLGIGGKVWDGSIAMLEFLFQTEARWSDELGLPDHSGCKIVDLGSATGILGLGISLLKPQCVVVNTDLPEVIPLLEMNLNKNPATRRNCFAEAYPWGSEADIGGKLRDIDIVTMCDVVYDRDCYQPLIASLVKLKAKHVLMSHRHRNRSEVEFFQDLAKIGRIECIKLPLVSDNDPYQQILANIPLSTSLVVRDKFTSTVDDVALFRIRLQ